MIEGGKGNILSVQYLRGFAALAVVVCHVIPQIERMGYVGSKMEVLASGVDVFFVISGFIMWITAGRHYGSSAGEFIKRRIQRIVPLYWILTTVVVAVLLVAPQLLQTTTFDLGHVVGSYLFIPVRHPVLENYYPVLNLGWTLNMEMFFYLLFAIAMLVSPQPARRATLMLSALTTLVLVGLIFKPTDLGAFYTRDLLLDFGTGIVLGLLYDAGRIPERPAAGGALIFGGVAMLALATLWPDVARSVKFGLPATAIVAGALMVQATGRGVAGAGLKLNGDASYSLYLSHFLVMSACGQAWRAAGLAGLPYWLFGLCAVAACLVAGTAVYYLIERPTGAILRAPRLAMRPA